MKPSEVYAAGKLLADKFRVVRLLGLGGMGAVYEVENELIAKRFALKVLSIDKAASPQLVKRFLREIKADGRIRNPHIVEVHDAGELKTGEPYLVMELLQGETLESLIQRKGKLDLDEICDLLGQACEGVQAAHHAGILHRDLKPANLFVTKRDGADFVKVLDFGIAKFASGSSDDLTDTREGAIVGTPYYMSPEQIRGRLDLDGRADVYALGVILYECATGRTPYQAETLPMLGVMICEGKPEPLAALRPDLPAKFRSCVAQAMAVERERRIPSAQVLLERLHAMGEGSSVEQPSSGDEPMRRTEIVEEPLDLPRPPLPVSAGPVQASSSRRGVWGAVLVALMVGALGATLLRVEAPAPKPEQPPTPPLADAAPKDVTTTSSVSPAPVVSPSASSTRSQISIVPSSPSPSKPPGKVLISKFRDGGT